MTLTMPSTPGFKRSRFGLRTNTQAGLQSPLTRATQLLRLPGAQWQASWTLPAMRRDKAAPWLAFLASLDGRANDFYGYDPDGAVPRGTGSGAPQVNGAGQTGTSLATDGWTAAVATVLKAGDYVAFAVTGGRQLHIVTADCVSSIAGAATIAIAPPLRLSPADNEPLLLTAAGGLGCPMRLVDDNQAAWEADENGIFNIAFSAIETF